MNIAWSASFYTCKENPRLIFFKEMIPVYDDKCLRYNTATYWIVTYKPGFMPVTDGDCEGRTHFVITEDNVTIGKKLVPQDRHTNVKQLSSEAGINVGSIKLILNDYIKIKKVLRSG